MFRQRFDTFFSPNNKRRAHVEWVKYYYCPMLCRSPYFSACAVALAAFTLRVYQVCLRPPPLSSTYPFLPISPISHPLELFVFCPPPPLKILLYRGTFVQSFPLALIADSLKLDRLQTHYNSSEEAFVAGGEGTSIGDSVEVGMGE